MPRINLLPWREAERKQRRQEFGAAFALALVVAAVIAFGVRMQMQSTIDEQHARNQYLKDEIASLDKQITEILDLEQRKARLLARMQVIEQLERSRPEIVHVFDQLVKTTPDGIYLTSVKQTDRRIQIRGMAQSSTRVASYMRNIDSSEWLSDPSLEILETKDAGAAGSEFILNAAQENPLAPPSPEGSFAAAGSAQ
jgi:type IV pilus assembly protein PilN